jgi:hypothetical protein
VAHLKEQKIKGLLSNLEQILNSLDTNFTCYLCMDMFKKPITCIPCGHNFCEKCTKDHQLTACSKCDKGIKGTIPDTLLEELVAKFIYQRDTLSAFKNEEVWKDIASAALKE